MATQHSLAGLETFDSINIEYERAYENNKFKKACINEAISLLPNNARVLDVGCGTGIPVSDMLSKAGLNVVGFDISPKMVKLAQDRVKGSFTVSDMLTYPNEGQFAAIFMIFCHLQLSYLDFHTAVYRFARALQPGGLFILGQMPSDTNVPDESPAYNETKSYVEDYDAPFMGEMLPTFMMSEAGQRNFFRSMGFEVVWERVDTFQPNNEKCVPEVQQYIIVKRLDGEVTPPKPLPKRE
ncbi:S-adenosyl-L-methionine-dependent methyltransferase [Xylogone sp. PMI_703]|nr:S-adenosyl-L-methionine-dependent methyltransferase [Xylogone sp. PMI_703]